MKCDEIFAALAMLEKERGISQTFMMDKIVQALTTAYKRDHEGVENVVVDVDEGKRELKMFVQKEVVDEVENPGTQMSLDDAKAISAKYNVGDIVNIPVDNIEFGRIAAALAPADVVDVRLAEEGKACRVIVPDDQLSLAIGKEGQNARLAARLVGYKIDIKPESYREEE